MCFPNRPHQSDIYKAIPSRKPTGDLIFGVLQSKLDFNWNSFHCMLIKIYKLGQFKLKIRYSNHINNSCQSL